MSTLPDKVPDPKRFEVSSATLRMDSFMTQFIKVGGIGIILTVFGIFLFIVAQVLPLFYDAKVERVDVHDTGMTEFAFMGVDEWSELPFFADTKGTFKFIDLAGDRGSFSQSADFPESTTLTASRFHPEDKKAIYGTNDGRFALVKVNYKPDFSDAETRVINVTLETEDFFKIGDKGKPVHTIDYFDAEKSRLVAAIMGDDIEKSIVLNTFRRKKSLFGVGKWQPRDTFDLTTTIDGKPTDVIVNGMGNAVIVSTEDGTVYYFIKEGREFDLSQTFKPFETESDKQIGSMNWLFGNESLVFTSSTGKNTIFSLSLAEGGERRQYLQTKTLDNMTGPATLYSKSLRNRSFLIGSGKFVSIRYSTTEDTRWEKTLDFEPVAGALGSKYKSIFLVEASGKLHQYALDDPHPEAGLKAFFSKIWYEGQNEPKYIWQSTGGASDFEPKLSMRPLISGTLKGTFYAMLFALPIAILAALYTSQFLKLEYKKVLKPTMEIMASLPSVVLGFIGALWLAPIIENKIPSIILILFLVPLSAIVIGWIWGYTPQNIRLKLKQGQEFIVFIPVLLLVTWIGWNLGPALEKVLFTVTNPTTGQVVADFRLWWPEFTGMSFEQRNSLVVGFMMGFAVIPIIFTIAEDSMSNVPKYLTSASLALGASRWQTAWRIVLPTASPGIFSALMIGLGRAIGETMILVMATGNTAIMDWNIFNGMRTLAANIAVELPEAPHHSTLYRSLFLGALLLFIMTFVINTLAEVARNHLRTKYKTVG